MIINAHEIREETLKTRVAIVGSGAAGAVLAYVLAESGVSCLVLEEGGRLNRQMKPRQVIRVAYRDGGFFTAIGRPVIPIPMGRCLGGTTAINSGTCFRTPPERLLYWQKQLGLSDLRPEDFEKAFDFVEGLIGVETASETLMSRGNTLFKEGLERLGLTGAPLLRNTKGCEGCGFCCYGCPSGAKQSMDRGVIPAASALGARFLYNAAVTTLERRGARVTSLKVAVPGERVKRISVLADVFVLSAGAVFSPALLLKSGIRLKNVGRFLTIHPTTKVLALFEEKIHGWRGIPQAYGYRDLKEEGTAFEGVFLPPDVVGATLSPRRFGEVIANYDRVAAFGALIRDSHYGRVGHCPLFGTRAFYSLTPEDVQKFKKAIAFMARVFLAAGARKVFAFTNLKDDVLQTQRDVERFLNAPVRNTDIESMGFHPLGTCRMGRTRDDSVVDQTCRVHGLDNLYICDGSVVPGPLGVNPQITIMAFAKRLGDRLGRSLAG